MWEYECISTLLQWKNRGDSAPYGPYGRLGLNSLKIPWFLDMSWFKGVQKAIGWPNGIEIVNIINLFVQVLDFGSPGSRTGRWSYGNCCLSDDGIFRDLEFAERVI